MASIKKDLNLMAMPLAMNRLEPQPLDSTSIWYSLEEAQSYAQTNGAAYVGQTLVVVDESNSDATAYLIINTSGDLQEIGTGTSSPMKFVADQAGMLGLTDIDIGQQVYREDTHTVWIFKGGDPATLSNWVESASQNDTVWFGTENKVNFYALTSTQYGGIGTKDQNTLYFLTDTGRILKGDVDVTYAVVTVASTPEASAAIANKLYINTTDLSLQITTDNLNWVTLTPGYLTDGANWAQADSKKLATIGLIKKGIQEAIDAIDTTLGFATSTGTVTVNDKTAILEGVAHGVSYDQSQMVLTIPVYGGDNVVVNIPKDKFVTAGQFYEDYPAEGEPTHHNVIVLTIDNQVEPVVIPAESLVNVYTADNEGKDIEITITEDNKISAAIKLQGATGGKIAVTAADGSIDESTFTIQNSGNVASMTATDIPVATLIMAAINAAVANKMDKISGIQNNLLIFGTDNNIVDSGKKIGGATLAGTPDENTLATEAAVKAAIDAALNWQALS